MYFRERGASVGEGNTAGDGCLSPSILDFMCGGEVSFKYAINAVFTQNPLLTTQVTSWTAETIRTRIIFESFQNKAPWRQIPLNENNEIIFFLTSKDARKNGYIHANSVIMGKRNHCKGYVFHRATLEEIIFHTKRD